MAETLERAEMKRDPKEAIGGSNKLTRTRMDQCNHCQQELIGIDNRGERLTGCLSCNWRKALDRSYARRTWLRCMSCDGLKRRRKCSGPSLVELSEGRPPKRGLEPPEAQGNECHEQGEASA
jgi:hypothetical protein